MLTDLCCLFPKVMVLAELFLEMLQRDFGYRIYKMLLSLPEKVVAPPEPEKEEAAKEEETVKEEAAKEAKDEVQSEGTAAESDAPPVSTSEHWGCTWECRVDAGAAGGLVGFLSLPACTLSPHCMAAWLGAGVWLEVCPTRRTVGLEARLACHGGTEASTNCAVRTGVLATR